jgi:hypothetical protein
VLGAIAQATERIDLMTVGGALAASLPKVERE